MFWGSFKSPGQSSSCCDKKVLPSPLSYGMSLIFPVIWYLLWLMTRGMVNSHRFGGGRTEDQDRVREGKHMRHIPM